MTGDAAGEGAADVGRLRADVSGGTAGRPATHSWITGWLWLPDPRAARRMALQVADERTHERLLDLGHGATLVRLDPGSAVLADGDGSAALTPVDLAAARPDPFCRLEDQWLVHLEQAHPEVFVELARHLPPQLARLPDARVRPLGVDRCGLRLRVEAAEADPTRVGRQARSAGGPSRGRIGHCHDVRLAFDSTARTPEELHVQLNRLIRSPGRPCPHGHGG